jgi:glycerophosphoryl diester phosphodiesterase
VENSIAAFAYALASGCDGFEFDVRHTRDGRDVLWHDPDWNGQTIAATDYLDLGDRTGRRLACLEDVLQHFGHRAWLDIELKVPGNEESVVTALRATPPLRGVIVSSFLPSVLGRLHDLAPELPLGFICDREEAIAVWREMPIRVLLPHCDLVQSALIAEAHQSGLQVMTWTVNDAGRMRDLAEWGIDGLISDDPQLLYQTFHSD